MSVGLKLILIRCIASVILLLYLSSISAAQKIDVDSAIEILQEVSAELEANLNSIKTLQGTYNLIDGSYQSMRITGPEVQEPTEVNAGDVSLEGVWQVREVSLKFKRDFSQNMLWTSYEEVSPTNLTVISSQKAIPPSDRLFHQISILTPEQFVYTRPNSNVGQLASQAVDASLADSQIVYLELPEDGKKHTRYSVVIDPYMFFGNMTRPFGAQFGRYAKSLKKSHDSLFTLVKEGDLYRLDASYRMSGDPDARESVASYRFGKSGVRWRVQEFFFTSPEGQLLRKINYEYRDFDGIDVPSKWVLNKYMHDGTHEIERVLTLQDCKINELIPEEQFEVANIGASDGARVLNTISEEVNVLSEGELVPHDKYIQNLRQEEVGRRTARRSMIIWFNVILIAVGGVLWYIISRKRAVIDRRVP